MKPYALFLFAGLLAGSCAAQTLDLNAGPPAILQIQLEMLKPGKSGTIHDRSEAAFIHTAQTNRSTSYYLAMKSVTGSDRVLFMSGYSSFAAWEKESDATDANPGLSAGYDKAALADGELLTDYRPSLWRFRPDLSVLQSSKELVAMRYFDITQYKIKPGHYAEFKKMAGIFQSLWKKNFPGEEFVVYQSEYGKDNGGLYIVLSPLHSVAEVDKIDAVMASKPDAEDKALLDQVPELEAAVVESAQNNLFRFSPEMSFTPPSWAQADPFWKPKASMSAKRKPVTP